MATLAAILLAVPAGWAVSRTPSVGWSLSMVIATYMLPLFVPTGFTIDGLMRAFEQRVH